MEGQVETKGEERNPLGYEDTGKLIVSFAVPSIISGLVTALYNIVDQIFIGQGVGVLGNAATNVAFPLSTLCLALALLIGVGSAANFSLELGAGDRERAGRFAGNGVSFLLICGVVLAVAVNLFLHPLMNLFGASQRVLPLALTYTGITSLGIPLVIFAIGCSNLIRADGSPKYAMICSLSGALLNTVLDPIFIFVFHMGIAGAAIATVIGQAVSAAIGAAYFFRFKTAKLTAASFRPSADYGLKIASLGMSACFNQAAMMLVQIVMNNTLTRYGAASEYGSEIPLACVGIITKVNIIYMAFVIGISQGCQPILGFNYGAENYPRVRRAFWQAFAAVTAVSVAAFLCFQLFPRQIISIFGKGDELYYQFGMRYFRIFLLCTFLNGIQPVSTFLFTSIGKAPKGILISMTRQIFFLLPLIVIFPVFMGIDGVMYAGPIADGAAALLALALVIGQMRGLKECPGEEA